MGRKAEPSMEGILISELFFKEMKKSLPPGVVCQEFQILF